MTPKRQCAQTNFRIREARPADALKIRNVHVASIRGLCAKDYTPEEIGAWTAGMRPAVYREAITSQEESIFVAEVRDRLVGFASLRGEEVRAVYVHPRFARQGVGSRLLRAVEQKAESLGLGKLRLHSSLTAAAFYRKHGYRGSRRVRHVLASGDQIPCVPMAKWLG